MVSKYARNWLKKLMFDSNFWLVDGGGALQALERFVSRLLVLVSLVYMPDPALKYLCSSLVCVRGIPPEMHGQSSGGATLAESYEQHARYACQTARRQADKVRLVTYESRGLHSFHSSSGALMRRCTPARAGYMSGACRALERAAVVQVHAMQTQPLSSRVRGWVRI